MAVVTIIEMQSAVTQDEVSTGVAPSALAAARIIAMEPPNPTRTATNPAMTTLARVTCLSNFVYKIKN